MPNHPDVLECYWHVCLATEKYPVFNDRAKVNASQSRHSVLFFETRMVDYQVMKKTGDKFNRLIKFTTVYK